MKRIGMVSLLAVMLALVGCVTAPERGGVTPTATDLPPGQAYVDSVDVLLMESFPVQVRVHIQGNLPDPCSEVTGTQTTRSGNAFTIELIVARNSAAMCAQVLEPFEQTVTLDVEGLPAGTYTVQVEGVSTSFTLDVDNVLPTLAP